MSQEDPLYLIPNVTGSLSVVSSGLILAYIIFRSERKLSTIYHRIIVGISCADILGSAAMALTSLPKPKTAPETQTWEQGRYNSINAGLGTALTCELQGFFFTFGTFTAFSYNCMLCVYYTLAIALRLKEQTIRTYCEPFLHIIPICIGLGMTIPSVMFDLFNPSSTEPWCTFASLACEEDMKKDWCEVSPIDSCLDAKKECYRGDLNISAQILTARELITRALCLVILLSFTACVWRVYRTERQLIEICKIDAFVHKNMKGIKKAQYSHNTTKVIVVQALAYTTAFALMLIFLLLREVLPGNAKHSKIVTFGFLFFLPLQGFFNLIIFCGHKVHNFRRVNHDVGLCGALKKLVVDSSLEEPFVMERISMINVDFELQQLNLEVENEIGLDEDWAQLNLEVENEIGLDKDWALNCSEDSHVDAELGIISSKKRVDKERSDLISGILQNSSLDSVDSPSLLISGLYAMYEDEMFSGENTAAIDANNEDSGVSCSSSIVSNDGTTCEDLSHPKRKTFYNVNLSGF